jgi:hypothetical protein
MDMKIVSFITTVLLLSVAVRGQTAGPAQQLAQKLAKRMQDTLQLSDKQYQQIYLLNMDLANRKQQARQQNPGQAEYLQTLFQQIENQRDSLYKAVIASSEKYQLYKNKKLNILRVH